MKEHIWSEKKSKGKKKKNKRLNKKETNTKLLKIELVAKPVRSLSHLRRQGPK